MGAIDLRTILTGDELASLRAAYKLADMELGARASTEGLYPPASAQTETILKEFYDQPDRIQPARRELCLIALGASKIVGSGGTLGVHLYWGLMEGLSVAEIADVLLLTGAYAGIDCSTTALGIFRTVLEKVLKPAAQGDAEGRGALKIAPAISRALAG